MRTERPAGTTGLRSGSPRGKRPLQRGPARRRRRLGQSARPWAIASITSYAVRQWRIRAAAAPVASEPVFPLSPITGLTVAARLSYRRGALPRVGSAGGPGRERPVSRVIPARLRRNQSTHPRWVEPVSSGDTNAPAIVCQKTNCGAFVSRCAKSGPDASPSSSPPLSPPQFETAGY
jgi:hypothetical protein